MQQNLRTLAAATPDQPLSVGEVITNDTLRMLAKGEPDWQRGTLSDELQAMLCMILPDLCAELLTRRTVMDNTSAVPFPIPRNHFEEISNIRAMQAAS